MKQTLYFLSKSVFSIGLATLMLTSCKKDKGPTAVLPGDAVRVSFTLIVPSPDETIDTYTSTKSNETVELSNIWAIQFDSLGRQIASDDVTSYTSGDVITFDLIGGKKTTIYFVANTVDRKFDNVGNIEAFKNMSYSGKFGVWSDLPYFGETKVDLEWNECTVHEPVEIIPTGSKITLTYSPQDDSEYTIQSIQLMNIPQNLYYYPGHTVTSEDVKNGLIISALPNRPYSYVIPENLQGTDNQITRPEDKITDRPATFLRVRAVSSDPDAPVAIFDIYPGANNTNDFNIERNHTYDLTGIPDFTNTDDKRLTFQ